MSGERPKIPTPINQAMRVNGSDQRIVCGAQCTWWDSISEAGKTPSGLPGCPRCHRPLLEYASEEDWFKSVDAREANNRKGYRELVEWGRGKCFLNQAALIHLFEHRLRGDVDQWCRDNWSRIPESTRLRCLDLLRHKVPAGILQLWRAQLDSGERVGSDVIGFHSLGGGMTVRNWLREVVPDDELPPVVYPNGEMARNWDDYYTGALEELVEAL